MLLAAIEQFAYYTELVMAVQTHKTGFTELFFFPSVHLKLA